MIEMVVGSNLAEVKASSLTSSNQISFSGLESAGNYKDRILHFGTQIK